jgi:hypothetical protein
MDRRRRTDSMVGGACAMSELQMSFGLRKPDRRARPLKARVRASTTRKS